MLSPKPLGPEQVLSPVAESDRSFMLARYTADVGPAQVDRTAIKLNNESKNGIGVIFESVDFNGATWRAIVLDDGTLIEADSVGSVHARHASCAFHGGAFVYEDRSAGHSPNYPPYDGHIMLRLGQSLYSQGLSPAATPEHLVLELGNFYYEKDREKSWDVATVDAFAPTICSVPRSDSLAFWNVGRYEPNSGSRTSRIRGCEVGPHNHHKGGPIQTFDFEWTSHTSDRFNANLHAFECTVAFEETDGTESLMSTVGLANSNANGLINFRIFDMRSGRFDPREIYSSEWSPAPGLDPAGNSGGGHPVVAWIGRDDGDVHVVVAQPRARLSAGIGSVFAFGTHFVANQPLPKGFGNRRPSVANVVVPGEHLVLVAWEAPHPHERGAYSYQDIKARVFDRSGYPRSDEFTLHDSRLSARAAPHVFPLADGGFYAFWMDTSEPPPGTGYGSWRIKGRRWTFDVI